MNTTLLLLITLFLPLGWGWGVHWCLERLWPAMAAAGEDRAASGPAAYSIDYQI